MRESISIVLILGVTGQNHNHQDHHHHHHGPNNHGKREFCRRHPSNPRCRHFGEHGEHSGEVHGGHISETHPPGEEILEITPHIVSSGAHNNIPNGIFS